MLRVLASACLGIALLAGAAQAATIITVNSTDSGGFGVSQGSSSGTPMEAFAILGAGSFQISATGSLFLDGSNTYFVETPDGISINFSGEILPLEERDGVDLNPSLNAGALIGAFVPNGTSGTAGVDEDFSGNVAAAALFLIGDGPFLFTAPGAGTLYLGINDSFAGNNRGSFTVTIDQVIATDVPEPAALAILGVGLVGLRLLRGRRIRSYVARGTT